MVLLVLVLRAPAILAQEAVLVDDDPESSASEWSFQVYVLEEHRLRHTPASNLADTTSNPELLPGEHY